MGFATGSAGSPTQVVQPVTRTFVKAVDRVMAACGISPAGTVTYTPGNERLEQAKMAVIDAAERIYNAQLWQFRYRWRMFQPEDAKAFYDLPEDWAGRGSFAIQSPAIDSDTGTHRPGQDLQYIDYHYLLERAGNLRIAPSAVATEGGLPELTRQNAIIQQGDGVPTHFTIIGNKLMLYPCPSQTAIDDQGLEYNLAVDYLFGFYGTMPPLEDALDPIPLPPMLMQAHHFLALAYLKQAAEYGDFQADEARGERLLMAAMSQALQQQGDNELGDFSHGVFT